MAYTLFWSPKSKEDLEKLSPETAKRIIRRVSDLELAPYHFVEKMTDTDCWKLRIGDYRALLDIDEKEKEIRVLKVGHRKNIYK